MVSIRFDIFKNLISCIQILVQLDPSKIYSADVVEYQIRINSISIYACNVQQNNLFNFNNHILILLLEAG
jgi:hypothetical protein